MTFCLKLLNDTRKTYFASFHHQNFDQLRNFASFHHQNFDQLRGAMAAINWEGPQAAAADELYDSICSIKHHMRVLGYGRMWSTLWAKP